MRTKGKKKKKSRQLEGRARESGRVLKESAPWRAEVGAKEGKLLLYMYVLCTCTPYGVGVGHAHQQRYQNAHATTRYTIYVIRNSVKTRTVLSY